MSIFLKLWKNYPYEFACRSLHTPASMQLGVFSAKDDSTNYRDFSALHLWFIPKDNMLPIFSCFFGLRQLRFSEPTYHSLHGAADEVGNRFPTENGGTNHGQNVFLKRR